MADHHAHDLERVTRYGNGFSRFRCRTPGCDYWTDARDDERTDEITRLRTLLTQLVGALRRIAEQAEAECYDPEFKNILGQPLCRSCEDVLPAHGQANSDCIGWAGNVARAALAAAERAGIR